MSDTHIRQGKIRIFFTIVSWTEIMTV